MAFVGCQPPRQTAEERIAPNTDQGSIGTECLNCRKYSSVALPSPRGKKQQCVIRGHAFTWGTRKIKTSAESYIISKKKIFFFKFS